MNTLPTVTLSIPTGLINDKTKDGWELLEDTPIEGNPELEFVEFLKSGESSVSGDVMFERAIELGNRAGQQHAERLLAQQESIPEELRQYYLIFPGTKWRDSYGGLLVPCLDWRGSGWGLRWYWLDGRWGSDGRLVRCK